DLGVVLREVALHVLLQRIDLLLQALVGTLEFGDGGVEIAALDVVGAAGERDRGRQADGKAQRAIDLAGHAVFSSRIGRTAGQRAERRRENVALPTGP